MADFGKDYTPIELEWANTWSDEKIEEHLKWLHAHNTGQDWVIAEIVDLRTEQRRREKIKENERLKAEAEACACWPTPPDQHYVYFGVTEPGSAMEHNPDCPVHGCFCDYEEITGDDPNVAYTRIRITTPDCPTHKE